MKEIKVFFNLLSFIDTFFLLTRASDMITSELQLTSNLIKVKICISLYLYIMRYN